MMRSAAYNRFGVLMGTSSRASSPRWLRLRGNSLLMITLISSQGDFCATADGMMCRYCFIIPHDVLTRFASDPALSTPLRQSLLHTAQLSSLFRALREQH